MCHILARPTRGSRAYNAPASHKSKGGKWTEPQKTRRCARFCLIITVWPARVVVVGSERQRGSSRCHHHQNSAAARSCVLLGHVFAHLACHVHRVVVARPLQPARRQEGGADVVSAPSVTEPCSPCIRGSASSRPDRTSCRLLRRSREETLEAERKAPCGLSQRSSSAAAHYRGTTPPFRASMPRHGDAGKDHYEAWTECLQWRGPGKRLGMYRAGGLHSSSRRRVAPPAWESVVSSGADRSGVLERSVAISAS